MILAPRFAMAWQIAAPIPPEAPVTSAVIWLIATSVPARLDLRDPSRRTPGKNPSVDPTPNAASLCSGQCASRAAGTGTLRLESRDPPAGVHANENLTPAVAGLDTSPRDATCGLCLVRRPMHLRRMSGGRQNHRRCAGEVERTSRARPAQSGLRADPARRGLPDRSGRDRPAA